MMRDVDADFGGDIVHIFITEITFMLILQFSHF